MINDLILTSAQPSAAADYIEDYFSTSLYTGTTGASVLIESSAPLAGTASWKSYTFGGISFLAEQITADSSGNIYVKGRNNSTGAPNTLKLSSSGTITWGRAYGTVSVSSTGALSVDTSGNVFASVLNGNSAYIAKYNSSGSLQWQRKLDGTAGYPLNPTSSGCDSSGNIYLAGDVKDGTNTVAYLLKYNSSGTLQWQKKYYGTSTTLGGTFYDMTLDSSGNVYAVGIVRTSGAVETGNVVKYDSSGTVQWQRAVSSIRLISVATDSSSNVYVYGADWGSTVNYLLKYNSSGTLQWQRTVSPNPGYGTGMKITADSSGNTYLSTTGGLYGNPILKFDTSGNLAWSIIFTNTSSVTGVGVTDTTIDSSGNLCLVGYATASGTVTGFVSVITPDGTVVGGSAFVTIVAGAFTASSSSLTEAAGGASSTTSSITATTPTFTDAASSATVSTVTQSTVSASSGLVWIKGRSGATDHALYDTARGVQKDLASNLTTGQTTQSTGVLSFNATGTYIGNLAKINTSSAIYAAWTFREQAKFFDVVTYTGNGANRTIAHNLGSVPGMIIIKRTDTTAAWAVYHRSLANTEYLVLNTTALKATGATYWNSTTATATEFSLGTSTDVNANGGTYVAYLFAHDAGGFGLTGSDSVISCGSYTTNASGVATVTLGWEPQFVIIKTASGATSEWGMYDNIRGFSLSSTWRLKANATDAENSMGATFYPTSTGFVDNGSTAVNSTFVYMAIRRGPMAVPTDATKVFMPTVYTGTNVNNRLIDTTIAPDMVWIRQRNDTVLGGMVVADRLRGQPYLLTGTTAAEVTSATAFDQQIVSSTEYGTAFSSMNGVWVGTDATAKLNVNTTASNHIAEAFKRAPGFHDIVCYSGTGVARTVSHNLGVAPELMIIKSRSDGVRYWSVYSASLGTSFYLNLNDTTAQNSTTGIYWNDTTPTASVFSLGNGLAVNTSGATYVAYLFASCPGVSKVGSYTGTGTTKQVDCGFTSGARLVLIKRTDSTGDWYIYDTARGIVAGNDPYLRLNSTGAEVTNTDYVDAYSAGFELSSTAPAGLNEAPGVNWTLRTSGFVTTQINAVTYGNGLYIAGGNGGVMTTSTDGITWTSRTSGFGTDFIRGITYGNGLYVAVGDAGKLTTSTDGITWTSRTSGFGTSIIWGATYGNGLYVAVGQSGTLTTSTDGITWTSRTSGFGTTDIRSVTYGNGLYVAVGDNGVLTTSTDGITWTVRTSGFGTTNIKSVTYGNGLFVAGGDSGVLTTSTDGITWTSRTSGFGTNFIRGLTYGNGIFVAVGDSGNLTTSSNGVTWTSQTSNFGTSTIWGATYGNELFVIVGQTAKLATSALPKYIYLAIA